MNKQRFASVLGIYILTVHVFLVFFLFAFFDVEGSNLAEISTPLAVTFVIAIAKWYIDTQGHITSKATIGTSYVIFVLIIVAAFTGGLVAAPIYYHRVSTASIEAVNQAYLVIEAGFGTLFSLFVTDLFKYEEKKPASSRAVRPATP